MYNRFSARRGTSARPAASRPRPSANAPASVLSPTVQVSQPNLQAFGALSNVGSSRGLHYFALTMVNSSSIDETFIIGDPNGIIESASGQSFSKPTSTTGVTYPTMVRSFAANPVDSALLNYEVSVSALQFSKSFQYVRADIDGSYCTKPVGVSNAKRNNQFNDKLLSLVFNELLFDEFNGLLLTVGAGETVNWSFELAGAANRGRVSG